MNDLQNQQRDLMTRKFALNDEVIKAEKEIKVLERELEDKKEDLKNLKETIEGRKELFDGLIGTVEKGIEIFQNQLNAQKTKN